MPRSSEREYRMMAKAVRAKEGASDDEMIVEGYATTFDEPYLLYEYGEYRCMEQIDKHAFDKCDMSDVIMQYDHEGRVYARTRNKTLTVEADEKGLKVTADLSKTDSARALYQEIREGMVDRMSFGFIAGVSERTYTEDANEGTETCLRTIKEIKKLYDVSAVSIPANDQTEISARSLGEGFIQEAKAERQRAQEKRRLDFKIRLMEENLDG